MDLLCLDFANTRWQLTHQQRRELLTDWPQLQTWLSKRGLLPDAPPDQGECERLLGLRSLLVQGLEQLATDQTIAGELLTDINQQLLGSTYVRQLRQCDGRYQQRLLPLTHDWAWVRAEIAASLGDLLCRGEPARVRICQNPECGWFFYDETKSRTKRWCDDSCANLMKVRRFRAKQA